MNEITTLDTTGLNFIKREEGCILHPYLDQVGIPTIGYGLTYYPHTGSKVTMKDPPITQLQANAMFFLILKPYCLAVYSTTRDDLTQNEFNALVSLAYNIGTGGFKSSTVHKLVDAHINGQALRDAFHMWNKANHKVVKDLDDRREREYQLYNLK